jgi:asparagine synthase (glutamine-hydrolysing)
MCGIYGVIGGEDVQISPGVVDRMAEAIRARGPDHSGRHTQSGVAIGMNRLSIVDLEGGNPPIYNEDGSLLIAYNGEVYNHLELRDELEKRGHRFRSRSDTETVLHAFEEYGPECLLRFNGIFAFAVFDRRRRKLFLGRDRLGVKPLYYAELPDRLVFASEAKALLPCLDRVEPDWTAIRRFFFYGYVPSPDSAFRGVRKLPPGHYAWLESGALRISRYWRPSYGGSEGVDFEEARARLPGLLRDAVRKELMSDVPVGVFLSGGLDSSAVAAFAREVSGAEVHSYGLRFPEQTHDESADARLAAEHLGIVHHELTFDQEQRRDALLKVAQVLDEPFGDSTVLPLLALSEFARRDVKVVLTGWGGDEIFAGYPTYKAHQMARLYRKLPSILSQRMIPSIARLLPVSDRYMSLEFKAKRFTMGTDQLPEYQHFAWMGYFDEDGLRRLLTPDVLQQADGDVLAPVRAAVAELEEEELVSRIMHLDALFFLEGNGLFQADRITMAASLEARVPLLNPDLFDYASSLPASVKMPRWKPKELFRQALASRLPPRILRKPKKGFGPPTAVWVRDVFRDVVERVLTQTRVEEQGIFRYDEVNRLLSEHFSRTANHGRNLWALLSFQLWHERFILNRDISELVLG